MKTLRLFCLLVCGLLLFAPFNYAENGNQQLIDSLHRKIEKLEQTIAEGSYTRIPNQDFENIINNKIETSLRETVNWWLIIIAAIASVVGFLINRYAKQHLQTILDERAAILKTEIDQQIKQLSDTYYSDIAETMVDFKLNTIQEKNYNVDDGTIEGIKKYLHSDESLVRPNKKIDIIDTAMRCYYNQFIGGNYSDSIGKGKGSEPLTSKMINLIKEFSAKYTLLDSTYCNAAIAFLDMYEKFGNKPYFNSVVENCNNALKVTPDYGPVFALKLELYLIAISKAFNESEKEEYNQCILRVFKDIENCNSTLLCKELVDRFHADKSSYLAPYLEKLYAQYPREIEAIQARVQASTYVKP